VLRPTHESPARKRYVIPDRRPKMMKKVSLLTLATLFAFAACSESDREPVAPETPAAATVPSFAATTEWYDEILEFTDLPWYLDCLDEELLWSGRVLFRHHFVTRPDGSMLVNGRAEMLPGNQLYSETSGLWLPMTAGFHNHFNGDWWPLGDWHVDENIRWQNQETGAIMDVVSKFHVVVAGNGELKLDSWIIASCKLRHD
jgi:hypothetical protein